MGNPESQKREHLRAEVVPLRRKHKILQLPGKGNREFRITKKVKSPIQGMSREGIRNPESRGSQKCVGDQMQEQIIEECDNPQWCNRSGGAVPACHFWPQKQLTLCSMNPAEFEWR